MLRRAVAVATLAALAGCPRPAPPRPPPVPVAPAAPAQLAAGDLEVFTADADAAYWYADGQVWRRAWTGAATPLAPLPDPPQTLHTYTNTLYALGNTTLTKITTNTTQPIATALPA